MRGDGGGNQLCLTSGLHTHLCAVFQVVYDIMKCWAKKHNVKPKEAGTFQAKILAKPPTLEANFTKASGSFSGAKARGEARFVQNPDNWGPRPRHGRPMLPHEILEAEKAAAATATAAPAADAAATSSAPAAAAAPAAGNAAAPAAAAAADSAATGSAAATEAAAKPQEERAPAAVPEGDGSERADKRQKVAE